MNLAFGVAAALFRRERTGEGALVDVSLLGRPCGSTRATSSTRRPSDATSPAWSARPPTPSPTVHHGRRALDRPHHARVGQVVAPVLPLPRPPGPARRPPFRRRRRPGRAQRGLRGRAAGDLRQAHPGRMARAPGRNGRPVGAAAGPAGGGVGPPGHRQRVRGRCRAPERPDPDRGPGTGDVRREPPELRPAPEAAADTEQILLDLGHDWDEIVAWKDAGVIA